MAELSSEAEWFQAQRAQAQQHVRATRWWHELCWSAGFESDREFSSGGSMGGAGGTAPHMFFGTRSLFYCERGRHVETPTHFVYCVSFLPWTMNTSANAFGGATMVVCDMMTAAANLDPRLPSPTAKLQVRFRRPVVVPGVFRVDVRHTAEAEPAAGDRKPRVTMTVDLSDEDGEILATGSAVVALDTERQRGAAYSDGYAVDERFAVLRDPTSEYGAEGPRLPAPPPAWGVETNADAMELVPAAVKNLLLEEAAEVQRRMDAFPYWQEVLADKQERWPIQHTQVTSPSNRVLEGAHFAVGTLAPWSLQRVLNEECDEQLWLVHFSEHCKNGMPAVLPQHAGSAHGGAISAVLDMVLSNGWQAASNGWTTATLEIDFKQPTPVPDIYTVRARIVEIEETERGPRVTVTADLTACEDAAEVFASATAVVVNPQQTKRDATAWESPRGGRL